MVVPRLPGAGGWRARVPKASLSLVPAVTRLQSPCRGRGGPLSRAKVDAPGRGGSSQRLGQPRRLLAHPGLCYDPRHGGVAVGASKPASRRPPPRLAVVTLEVILQSLVSGLLMGGVYALIAAGLSLIFGLMELVNFAHGEFLMLAMFIALGSMARALATRPRLLLLDELTGASTSARSRASSPSSDVSGTRERRSSSSSTTRG